VAFGFLGIPVRIILSGAYWVFLAISMPYYYSGFGGISSRTLKSDGEMGASFSDDHRRLTTASSGSLINPAPAEAER
jgi:hypothetical protein